MNIEAFILIGGRSSRLGRDKAFERVGGRTLAERALRTVERSRTVEKATFVTGNRIDFAIEAARMDARFVFDLVEGRGPLGGLYTALMHATSDWVFVLACDLPLVTPELIDRLSGFREGEYGAVVPEQPDGLLQPLCAFYNTTTVRPIVETIIGRPRVPPPMYEIFSLLTPRIVKPDEYEPVMTLADVYFKNVNTEQDLTDARELERKLYGESEI